MQPTLLNANRLFNHPINQKIEDIAQFLEVKLGQENHFLQVNQRLHLTDELLQCHGFWDNFAFPTALCARGFCLPLGGVAPFRTLLASHT